MTYPVTVANNWPSPAFDFDRVSGAEVPARETPPKPTRAMINAGLAVFATYEWPNRKCLEVIHDRLAEAYEAMSTEDRK